MAIVVNDPEKLPIKILQINMSQASFLSFILKRPGIGLERDNYFIIRTDSNVSWLQPTQELQSYHLFLRQYFRKGFTYLMIMK